MYTLLMKIVPNQFKKTVSHLLFKMYYIAGVKWTGNKKKEKNRITRGNSNIQKL